MEKITKKEKNRRKKQLVNRLDIMASTWVRNQSDKCVSCHKILSYKQRQCGHFIRREIWETRWDPKNLHIECPICNGFSPDHLIGYSNFMIEENLFDWAKDIYLLYIKKEKENKFNYLEAKKWYLYWYDLCKKNEFDCLKRGWDNIEYFDCLEEYE